MYWYSVIPCIRCLYLAPDSICKSLFYIWSVFNLGQVTDKQANVTGVSTVLFIGSNPQILWRSNSPCLVFIRWLFQFSHFFFRISNIFDLNITKETWVVEMCIWCIKIGTVLVFIFQNYPPWGQMLFDALGHSWQTEFDCSVCLVRK
jgi:hypothetical protein